MASAFDARRLVNVPNRALGFATNCWLGKFTTSALQMQFFAVFLDWHTP
jgi:hypothetical protein